MTSVGSAAHIAEQPGATSRDRKGGRLWLIAVQICFLVTALFQLDSPFVSAHNERQNQTYDIARHVFHEGWSAVVAPKASFSLPGLERQPFTSLQLEFPFHGLLGWPLAAVIGHERAAVRTVSILFALLSIGLVYAILGRWTKPATAVFGAALWAAAPLVLQFGQAPMPDILCTAGMLAAFWFALRGNLALSSGWFLFAILAKTNVIVFGLPILVALLLTKGPGSVCATVSLCVQWGAAPLLGLIGWILLAHWCSPPTPWNFLYFVANEGLGLLTVRFWTQVAGCLLPFGMGVLGGLALLASLGRSSQMDRRLRWAVVAALAFYVVLVIRKVYDPQYFLPPLAWLILMGSPGLEFLWAKMRAGWWWQAGLAGATALHLLVACLCTADLKASRVPDFASVERVCQLLPPGARVVVAYRFYGASAAVWLQRNVYAVRDLPMLTTKLPELKAAGYTHLCLLEIETRHTLNAAGAVSFVAEQVQRLFGHSTAPAIEDCAYTGPASSLRQYCDRQFPVLFGSTHARLYSLDPQPTP